MHPCFVQYGDFAEAVARSERCDVETYRAQDYSVGWIARGSSP